MNEGQSLKESSTVYATESEQVATYAQQRFYASALCKEARGLLQSLVDNPDYNTESSPTINPIPFIERHLQHLSAYPKTNLQGYMSNLRLMTSKKHARPKD
jgi:hypothetical protein